MAPRPISRSTSATNKRLTIGPGERDRLDGRQVRSVFFVGLIPCAFSHALCSACAFVSAAVLGRLAGFPFGVDILITRDIGLAPAGYADKLYQSPERMSCLTKFGRSAPACHLVVFEWLATDPWQRAGIYDPNVAAIRRFLPFARAHPSASASLLVPCSHSTSNATNALSPRRKMWPPRSRLASLTSACRQRGRSCQRT